ncbi:torsin-1A-like [Mytilus californianus]|uniref:torsin-1A-like n=1 Tax=Mytilus californianus TaxID=6549 RepID=UPI0022481134|nr:torsin-1A-like [Mytilus californianus]
MTDQNPPKALSLAFHGGTGTGKNYISSIIAESLYTNGMESEFVHFFSSSHHFPNKEDIIRYKTDLPKFIERGVQKCKRSLFIFDEVDEMPKGLMNTIAPFMDYYQNIDGVNYRQSIFLFISNIGTNALNKKIIEYFKQGLDRKSITIKDMEHLIKTDNESNEFSRSQLFSHHLMTAHIPFFPMEKKHVRQCVRNQLLSKKYYRAGGAIEDEVVENIMRELDFYPDDNSIFSPLGCKRVSDKVDLVMND